MTIEVFDGSGEQLLLKRSTMLQPLLVAWLISTFAISLLDTMELAGFRIEEIESLAFVFAIMIVGVAAVIVNVGTIVVFAMWIYRAAANIRDADVPGFEYTPGWAVGWYFIPFANFVKPFSAMRQIWNASRGATIDLDEGHSTLTIWWAFWLISNIANNISLRMSLKVEDPNMLETGIYFGLIGSVASVPLYFAAKNLVQEITDGQSRFLHRT
jgi:Domain of unknown function (DUF4328)